MKSKTVKRMSEVSSVNPSLVRKLESEQTSAARALRELAGTLENRYVSDMEDPKKLKKRIDHATNIRKMIENENKTYWKKFK